MTKPQTTPAAPTPPALPPEAVAALTPLVENIAAVVATKAVEAAFASRPSPPAPVTSGGTDLQLDVPKDKARHAALGVSVKMAYLAHAERAGFGKDERFNGLRKFCERVKAAGLFATIFAQGGALVRETQSTDTSLLEILRGESVLLRAGAMTVSDYGARLTIGKLSSGVTVYWLDEGEPPTKSDVRPGLISLGAHKVGALAEISNDLLRLGTMDASALVGRDMAAAITLEVDKVGIKGSGAKKPLGFRNQLAANTAVAATNVGAIAGTSTANKIADLDDLVKLVDVGNLPGGVTDVNSPFYLMEKETMYGLRGIRDNAGWVFESLRDLRDPRINGFPVFTTTTVSGDDRIDFGLAKFLMLGEARPLEIELGRNGNNFASDMMSLVAFTEVDWLVRRAEAFASKTGVTY